MSENAPVYGSEPSRLLLSQPPCVEIAVAVGSFSLFFIGKPSSVIHAIPSFSCLFGTVCALNPIFLLLLLGLSSLIVCVCIQLYFGHFV